MPWHLPPWWTVNQNKASPSFSCFYHSKQKRTKIDCRKMAPCYFNVIIDRCITLACFFTNIISFVFIYYSFIGSFVMPEFESRASHILGKYILPDLSDFFKLCKLNYAQEKKSTSLAKHLQMEQTCVPSTQINTVLFLSLNPLMPPLNGYVLKETPILT